MSNIKKMIILLAAALLPAPAISQTEGGHFYAGVSGGLSKVDDCNPRCDNELAFAGLAGYRFSDLFAAEGGFLYASGFTTDPVELTIKTTFLGGLVYLPVSGKMSFFGKGGMHFWKLKIGDNDSSDKLDDNDPYFGVGLQYMINDKTSLRGSWTRYKMKGENGGEDGWKLDEDFDVFGVDLVFNF